MRFCYQRRECSVEPTGWFDIFESEHLMWKQSQPASGKLRIGGGLILHWEARQKRETFPSGNSGLGMQIILLGEASPVGLGYRNP
jgi:hypothetical protein